MCPAARRVRIINNLAKIMKKIVSTGRGGVGKTCFIAGLTRFLKDRGNTLLIDADPDQSLAEMVGVDMESERVKTISEILFDIKSGSIEGSLKSLGLAGKVDYLLNQHALFESDDFDLLSLGTKWTEGCYCQPNYTLKTLLERIEKNYTYVLIDSPAGLEHLNRRVTSSIDDIFAIISPTKKAIDNMDRSSRIMREIGIDYRNFYLVANCDFPPELVDSLNEREGFTYAGKLAHDPDVARFTLDGESLLNLSDDSPFLISVRNIIQKAGY